VYLDTHVVVWLAAGLKRKLSPGARKAIEAADELLVSPMVSLELAYLHEIGRVTRPPATVLAQLIGSIGLRTTDQSLASLVSVAMELNWTRDVFDRLIVSECIHAGQPLLTKDRTIRRHFEQAVW
jgi:PIN domain nuclease of toxin-antitoxin system